MECGCNHWIPSSDEVAGNAFCRTLFCLMLPEQYQTPAQAKMQVGSVVTHPVSGLTRFPITDAQLPIHADADEHAIDPFIQPYVDAGDIPESDLVDMQNAIIAAKGGTMNMWANCPAYWVAMGMTDDEMAAEGWFTDPEAEE